MENGWPCTSFPSMRIWPGLTKVTFALAVWLSVAALTTVLLCTVVVPT